MECGKTRRLRFLFRQGLLQQQLRTAEQALVQLEIAGEMVPAVDWLFYAFVRNEAVVSPQIEGTQATLIDLPDLP